MDQIALQEGRVTQITIVEARKPDTVVTVEKSGHGLWDHGIDASGQHYAVREIEPLFCLVGDTRDEVETKAGQTFESYLRLQAG